MGLLLVNTPAEEPLTVAEAKLHLRIPEDQTAEDGLVDALVRAAREYCEGLQRRAYVEQTWRLTLDEFPYGSEGQAILVPKPPLKSVASIKYRDNTGSLVTLAASEYTVDLVSQPGRIVPAYGKYWPNTRSIPNAVEVEFVCGYGTAASVPTAEKQAMKLLIGHWYANREAVITGTIQAEIAFAVNSLLSRNRMVEFA